VALAHNRRSLLGGTKAGTILLWNTGKGISFSKHCVTVHHLFSNMYITQYIIYDRFCEHISVVCEFCAILLGHFDCGIDQALARLITILLMMNFTWPLRLKLLELWSGVLPRLVCCYMLLIRFRHQGLDNVSQVRFLYACCLPRMVIRWRFDWSRYGRDTSAS
jgi:hypothetical protein